MDTVDWQQAGELLLRWHVAALAACAAFFAVWLQYYHGAALYMRHCRDKKWPAQPDPAQLLRGATVVAERKKRVYFVRHGESCWNVTFNRSKLFMIYRVIYTCIYETYLLLTSGDSWLVDSPLCRAGVRQAESVREFIKNNKGKKNSAGAHADVLSHESDKQSILVFSNLRRCISTGLIAFHDRLVKEEERAIVLNSLQEITTNPDGLSLTPPYKPVKPSWFDVKDRSVKAYDLVKAYASHLNVSENAGNKPLTSNGLQRMTEFNKWLFDPELQCDTVIVVGHSLWFRSYFATFLPHDVKPLAVAAAAKKQKMCNGGIVAFDVVQKTIQIGNAQKTVVMIAPDSVEVVHGRFKG